MLFNRDSEARGSTIHRFQVPLLKIFEFHNVLQSIIKSTGFQTLPKGAPRFSKAKRLSKELSGPQNNPNGPQSNPNGPQESSPLKY